MRKVDDIRRPFAGQPINELCHLLALLALLAFFFFYCYGDHRDLHSFPTRRSSDLSTTDVDDAAAAAPDGTVPVGRGRDRKSTRLNSSHVEISYAGFCLKKKILARQRTHDRHAQLTANLASHARQHRIRKVDEIGPS